jgi:hypothetical protein
MSLGVNQNILWLQVSVYHIPIVEMFKCQEYLGETELSLGLRELAIDFRDVVKKLPSCAEVKDQVQIGSLTHMTSGRLTVVKA